MVWKLIAFLALIFVLVLGAWIFFGDAIIERDDDKPDIGAEFSMRIDSLAKCIKQGREEAALLRYKIEMLNLKFDISRQSGKYLVLDRHGSRFWIREGDAILHEGTCGVGRGSRWIKGKKHDFETPAGRFDVMRKIEDPWWYRPDWFWTEKGMKVPKHFIQYPKSVSFNRAVEFYNSLSKEDKLRVRAVPGYLGQYALQIAEGIYIHYGSVRRGRVSHGCIRVSKSDAETLYRLLDVGTPVYVY